MFLPAQAFLPNPQLFISEISVSTGSNVDVQATSIVCWAFQNRYEYGGKPTIHKNAIVSGLRVHQDDWWESSVLATQLLYRYFIFLSKGALLLASRLPTGERPGR